MSVLHSYLWHRFWAAYHRRQVRLADSAFTLGHERRLHRYHVRHYRRINPSGIRVSIGRRIWHWLPDTHRKRAACGGFWTHYHTGLQMASVWYQSEGPPQKRLPCQLGSPIATENHGPVRILLYPD